MRKFLELAAPIRRDQTVARGTSLELALPRHFVPGYDRLSLRDNWTAGIWRSPNPHPPEGECLLGGFRISVSGTIHFVTASSGEFGRYVNAAKQIARFTPDKKLLALRFGADRHKTFLAKSIDG